MISDQFMINRTDYILPLGFDKSVPKIGHFVLMSPFKKCVVGGFQLESVATLHLNYEVRKFRAV